MTPTERRMIAHGIDPPARDSDEPPGDVVQRQRQEIAALTATVALLESDNAKLRADHPTSVPEWKALKSVARGQFTYEAARQWCVDGVVTAEKRRGRWFVAVDSMVRRLRELAI